jgi:hypothetical protein
VLNKAVAFDQQPRPSHDHRYTRTGTCSRWEIAVAHNRTKFVTVSRLKRLRDGRFTSETAVRRFQKRNGHLDPELVKQIHWHF